MIRLMRKYIKALKKEVEAQHNLIQCLLAERRIKARIEDINKLQLWVTPSGNTLMVYPQTKDYLRSLREKLYWERKLSEATSQWKWGEKGNWRDIKIGENLPGIVW